MNPMLGHRGCRLGLTYPEIYEMQVEAIIRAALAVKARGVDVQPEIMIPLVGTVRELKDMREMSVAVADRVMAEVGAEGRLPGRHHDRDSARRAAGGQDRRSTPTSSASAPTT